MKKLGKVLLTIVAVIVVLAVVIAAIRAINGHRTKELEKVRPETAQYNAIYKEIDLQDPTNSKVPNVAVSHVDQGFLQGYHLVPNGPAHPGAVVVFGGSEGSCSFPLAAQIAKQGFEVYAMYYFGQPNEPAEFSRVPLDFFKDLHALVQKQERQPGPLTLVGASKGAELVLALAATYPDLIGNVVAYAPSSHVYQGLSFKERTPHSSWTFNGQELPFVSFNEGSLGGLASFVGGMILGLPTKYITLYQSALAGCANYEQARIKIENFKGGILLFVGDQDKMWPSAQMAQVIKEHVPQTEIVSYKNAGHVFYGPPVLEGMLMGGTYEANEQAKPASDAKLFETLAAWSAKR